MIAIDTGGNVQDKINLFEWQARATYFSHLSTRGFFPPGGVGAKKQEKLNNYTLTWMGGLTVDITQDLNSCYYNKNFCHE